MELLICGTITLAVSCNMLLLGAKSLMPINWSGKRASISTAAPSTGMLKLQERCCSGDNVVM